MRYLVTGGLGVIGSCIARRLLAAPHCVSIIDSAEEPRNSWIGESLFSSREPPGTSLEFKRGRLECIDIESALSAADAVIHCAASTGIPYSVTQPAEDWERNVEGTRSLLEALRENPRPTVVLSSVKPYRVTGYDLYNELGRGLNEMTPLEPDEPYAASKAAQSMLCQAYAKSYGIPVVTFRCSNLYGSAPCHGPRHGWLTWFAISAAIGRPIEVQGTGQQTRDMLHADDVFTACMAALENADRLKGEVFNIGGGADNRISVGAAAAWLKEHAGTEVVAGPARAMDDDHVFVNFGKFKSGTGWEPKIGVMDGLERVYRWAHENRDELRKLYEGVQ